MQYASMFVVDDNDITQFAATIYQQVYKIFFFYGKCVIGQQAFKFFGGRQPARFTIGAQSLVGP